MQLKKKMIHLRNDKSFESNLPKAFIFLSNQAKIIPQQTNLPIRKYKLFSLKIYKKIWLLIFLKFSIDPIY